MVFGRGMGYNLDALQHTRRQRFEVLLQAFGLEMRRLVVYPDGDLGATAILDVTLGVNLYTRCVLQRVGGVAALYTGVVADIIEHLLAVGRIERPAGGDLYLLQYCGVIHNLNGTEVSVLHDGDIPPVGLMSHGTDTQKIITFGDTRQRENTVEVTCRSVGERAIRRF